MRVDRAAGPVKKIGGVLFLVAFVVFVVLNFRHALDDSPFGWGDDDPPRTAETEVRRMALYTADGSFTAILRPMVRLDDDWMQMTVDLRPADGDSADVSETVDLPGLFTLASMDEGTVYRPAVDPSGELVGSVETTATRDDPARVVRVFRAPPEGAEPPALYAGPDRAGGSRAISPDQAWPTKDERERADVDVPPGSTADVVDLDVGEPLSAAGPTVAGDLEDVPVGDGHVQLERVTLGYDGRDDLYVRFIVRDTTAGTAGPLGDDAPVKVALLLDGEPFAPYAYDLDGADHLLGQVGDDAGLGPDTVLRYGIMDVRVPFPFVDDLPDHVSVLIETAGGEQVLYEDLPDRGD